MTIIKVKHVLKTKNDEIWSIAPDATVYKALQLLAEKNIGALLVIQDEEVIGIFSERDYARKVILKGKSSRKTLVNELMTENVFSIGQENSLEDCMKLMSEKHIRHVPVIEDGKLIGILSVMDVVKKIITEQENMIRDLENYITGKNYSAL